MPWIKNIVPSLYFTADQNVDKITFPPDHPEKEAAITLDRYGAQTSTNWAFRVMSEEQAKKIGFTGGSKGTYQTARLEIAAAGNKYKDFMKSVLMTEDVEINGKKLKGMTGVNYNTLKHAQEMFKKGDIDITKQIVWTYKVLQYVFDSSKKLPKSNATERLNKMSKMANNDTNYSSLSNALLKKRAAKKNRVAVKNLKHLGVSDTRFYDGGKYMKVAASGQTLSAHTDSEYILIPVKRFKLDSGTRLSLLNPSPPAAFLNDKPPEWLDRMALKYVPRKYYLPLLLDINRASLPGYQHDAWAGRVAAYRSIAYKDLNPTIKDFVPGKFSKRKPYDSVIQQSIETLQAWESLDIAASDGTKKRFLGTSNFTKPFYSANNPVFPYGANDIEAWKADKKGYVNNNKGTAPFSKKDWLNLATPNQKNRVPFLATNPSYGDVLNPTGATHDGKASGDRDETGFRTFGIAGLLDICHEVYENYPKSQGGKAHRPWWWQSIFSFLQTGPSRKQWKAGKLWVALDIRTDSMAQHESELEAMDRYVKLLGKLWKEGLNMGCGDAKHGLTPKEDAFVYTNDGNNSAIFQPSSRRLSSLSKEDREAFLSNFTTRYGKEKYPCNLLRPLYRVEISNPFFALFYRIAVFIFRQYQRGIIPKQKGWDFADGLAEIQFFSSQDGSSQAALRMMIEMVWAVMFEFNYQDKKIEKVKDANKSIPKDSKMVVTGKGVQGQILENMQCFMLNLVDVFSKFHKPLRLPYFTKVTGDNTNIFNLLGYKPETIDMLLRMTPHQLARMQPRIKLFKERVIYKKNSNIVLKRETVEVAGPFATHTDVKSIEESLAQGSGRNLGGGIKEITLKEGSGDMVNADVPSDDTIEITFLFNTLQEIFLNFPRYDDNGNHAGFPYGIQPRHAHLKPEDVPASYAELIFPSSRGQMDEYIQVVNMFREEFNIILELGWSPPDNLKNLTPYEKAVFDKLREASLYRTFVLSPIDSEFNFTNEGQVELIARYKGIARYQQSKTINRLFPLGGISSSAKLSDDKEVIAAKKVVEKYSKQQKGKIKGKSTILSAVENAELQRARTLIMDKIDVRRAAEFDNYVREQLDDLMRFIFNTRPINKDGRAGTTVGNKGNIYILHVPKALLGARGDSNKDGVLKWQTTRDIELLKQFPKNVTRSTGTETKKGSQRDVSTRAMDAAKKTSGQNSPEAIEAKKQMEAEFEKIKSTWTGNKDKLKEKLEEIRKKYKKRLKTISTSTKKAAQKAASEKTGNLNASRNSWPIYFMFYGDVVNGAFAFSESELAELQSRIHQIVGKSSSASGDSGINFKKNIHEHTRLILGSIKVPIVSGGKATNYNINISDLPMTTHFFTQFIIDVLITPKGYGITKIDFCEKLLKRLIYMYFNSKCFYNGSEVSKTHPQIHYFTTPQLSKRKNAAMGIWEHLYNDGVGTGVAGGYTREQFKQRMKKIEQLLNSKPDISASPHFKYAFIGARSFAEGAFDFKKDLEQNIHHFYFGAGEGLVKNVSFKSEQLEHISEAVFYDGIQMPGTEIDAFIPRIFNVDVTMIGNTLFRPGHTFYLDPTMGTMLGQPGAAKKKGIDIIQNTGLGGYFYVASIETRIAPGVYETTLEGIKTGVAKNKDRARQKSFNPTDLESSLEKAPSVSVPKPGTPEGFFGNMQKGFNKIFN